MTTPRSFSPLCKRHRRRRDRAGHPEQLQLTLAALRPYILLIEDTHERNLDSPLWSHLLARYQALVGLAREHSVGTYPGRSRTPPRAADIILKVSQPRSGAQVADPAEVIRHQLAAHLMRYQRPGLFRNDAAFRYALVKRWRYFAPASKGYEVLEWNAVLAPVGVSAPVKAKLAAAIRKAMADPEVLGRVRALGGELFEGGEAQAQTFLQAQQAQWSRVVRERRISRE